MEFPSFSRWSQLGLFPSSFAHRQCPWLAFFLPITVLWYEYLEYLAPLVAQTVKNPPAMWETWIGSLGCEDPLENGMATPSSILAWRIHGQRSLAWAIIRALEIQIIYEEWEPSGAHSLNLSATITNGH